MKLRFRKGDKLYKRFTEEYLGIVRYDTVEQSLYVTAEKDDKRRIYDVRDVKVIA